MYKIAVQKRHSASYICGMLGNGTYDVVLLLGGNLGDSAKTLAQALNLISKRIGPLQATSQIYRSPAWGFESEHDFLNQAVVVRTEHRPRVTLNKLLEIEQELGRVRQGTGYTDRIIDIDILCWEEKIFWTSSLQVPHIKLHERAFALAPLAEIYPNWRHPILEKTVLELLGGVEENESRPLSAIVDG